MAKSKRERPVDPPVLQRIIYQLSYKYGYTYLDRCGSTINEIKQADGSWEIDPKAISPQNAKITNKETRVHLTFSSENIHMQLDRYYNQSLNVGGKVEKFCKNIEDISRIVIASLEIEDFTRIGCRCIYIIPSATMDESVEMIDRLNFGHIDHDLVNYFGGNKKNVSFLVVVNGDDRDYRINISPAEINNPEVPIPETSEAKPSKRRSERDVIRDLKEEQRKKDNPDFGILIDIDAYIENPELQGTREYAEFVENNYREIPEIITKFVTRKIND